jgi:PIN domain nuclease of toxin-antitoxin system
LSSVLDASALLAYLQGEPGAEQVGEALARPAAISAINYAEVLAKLAEDGETIDELATRFEAEGLIGGVLDVEAVPAEEATARELDQAVRRRGRLSVEMERDASRVERGRRGAAECSCERAARA